MVCVHKLPWYIDFYSTPFVVVVTALITLDTGDPAPIIRVTKREDFKRFNVDFLLDDDDK